MRIAKLFLMILATAWASGCDRQQPPHKVEGQPPMAERRAPVIGERPPIEVNAPGVHVKVDPRKGTEVTAPGVEVETPPKR